MYFSFIDYSKTLTVQVTTNCSKFFKRCEYQATWPGSWETCMQVKKQQLGLDIEQWTAPKLGIEYVKAVCCHPSYLLYIKSISCEMLGLKFNFQKAKFMASSTNRWGNNGNSERLYFLGLQNHCRWWLQPWN